MEERRLWRILIAFLGVFIMGWCNPGNCEEHPIGKSAIRSEDPNNERKFRRVEITVEVDLNAPAESADVRLWIPYPVSDEDQIISDIRIEGNFSSNGVYRESRDGSNALFAAWDTLSNKRTLRYSFRVEREEVARKNFPRKELPFSKEEFKKYLEPTGLAPVDGEVKQLAERIVRGKKTNLAKARAIYDWVISNMHRDPEVKGCGLGEVEKLLETRGGKCADIHSVFVALSRSVGVPAREIFGLRLPEGKEVDLTKAQDCWVEFYLPGYGWVPADPASVVKAMFLKKTKDLQEVSELLEYSFGAVNEHRVAFGAGRDIILNPSQKAGELNYFMFPYAEVNGKMLNEDICGFNLGYKINCKEL